MANEEQAVKIHGKARGQVLKRLAEAISNCLVSKRCGLIPESWMSLSAVTSVLHKSVVKYLEEIVGDGSLAAFLYPRLEHHLSALHKHIPSRADGKRIAEISGINPEELAKTLLSELESLPWNYSLLVKLPMLKDSGLPPSVEISDDVVLLEPEDTALDKFNLAVPPKTLGEACANAYLGKEGLSVGKDHYYLMVRASGFIDNFASTLTYTTAMQKVKAFLGLGLATGLFTAKYLPRDFAQYPVLVSYGGNAETETHYFSPDESSLIRRIQTSDEIHSQTEAIRDLKRIARAFLPSDESDSLRLAGQWYFESMAGDNKVLQFIQRTIVLEVIFGDKTKGSSPITQKMANRCGYALGTSHKERASIIKKFENLYETRSRIVHSGKNTLDSKAQLDLLSLNHLAARAISKELSLLPVNELRWMNGWQPPIPMGLLSLAPPAKIKAL